MQGHESDIVGPICGALLAIVGGALEWGLVAGAAISIGKAAFYGLLGGACGHLGKMLISKLTNRKRKP